MPVMRRFGYALVVGLAALLAALAAPHAAGADPDHTAAQEGGTDHTPAQEGGTDHTAAQSGDVHITVEPSTVEPGLRVEIRASCGDDLNPAKVRSRAFPEITLTAGHDGKVLAASVTVSRALEPGDYRVRLRCANGSSAATDLMVLHMERPTRGPDTGGGGLAGEAPHAVGGAAAPPTPLVLGVLGAVALAGAGTLAYRGRRADREAAHRTPGAANRGTPGAANRGDRR